MLTELGKFLRKLRIDRGEKLLDMSKKLGVSASFLSAVENGKKNMPSDWNSRIAELYTLNVDQVREFTIAVSETIKSIEINLLEVKSANRDLAISFAREFENFDDDQIKQIRSIMGKGGR